MDLTDGTFREEVHDILAGGDHAIALVRQQARRDDRFFDYPSVHVWHVRDGRLSEFWEFPDPEAFNRLWSKPPYDEEDYVWGMF